jgi:NADH-quinone oxidoreductase subunit E
MDHTGDSQGKKPASQVASMLIPFKKERGNLNPILQMVQEKYHYLSRGALHMVAGHLNVSSSEVYGVATFYNQFRFHSPGKHQIKVCPGTACHVRGGDIILENFERKLGIKEGETTPDREFSVDRIACVGCCALAPVEVIDDIAHGHMAASKVEGLMLGFEIEGQRKNREQQHSEPKR